MKKSTKKTIMALSIVLIFGLSSIAFFFTGITGYGAQQQSQEFKPLTTNVVEGKLDPLYKETYVNNGYTWVEFYYGDKQNIFMSFMDSLPSSFTTPTGQPQIVVQKFNETYANESIYFIMTSNYGVEKFSGDEADKMFDVLCRLLTFTPIECSFNNLTASGNAAEANSNTNITANVINSENEINNTINMTTNSSKI
jgi:hypothetical protein